MNKSVKKNKGMATLLITVIVLVMMTIMVIFATKVGIFDQRMAANEARYKEAFATAEAGLDMAVQRFDNKFRQSGAFTGTDDGSLGDIIDAINAKYEDGGFGTSDIAAGAGMPRFSALICPSSSASCTTPVLPSVDDFPIYEFISTGIGADGTGTATIRRQISMGGVLGGGAPDVPIVVAGSVGTGGDFNVVANPNGGGPGVPASIWTQGPSPLGDVNMDGSSATCHIEFFDGNNPQCSNPSGNTELISQGDTTYPDLTAYDATFPDVLPNDPNFPPDLFKYLFGVAKDDWNVIKSRASQHNQVVDDCSSLDANSGENYIIWWVEGDCNMGSNQIIGSMDKPVILVIDDHEIDMGGGNARIYGILFLFDNPTDIATPSTDFHGGPAIYGALISEVGGGAMNGSYSIVYERNLLERLTVGSGNSSAYDLAYIPGSWRDFN